MRFPSYPIQRIDRTDVDGVKGRSAVRGSAYEGRLRSFGKTAIPTALLLTRAGLIAVQGAGCS